MKYKNLKKRQLVNETASESCDENESHINTANQRKRLLNVLSTSESQETDTYVTYEEETYQETLMYEVPTSQILHGLRKNLG